MLDNAQLTAAIDATTAPRLTPEQIDATIVEQAFHRLTPTLTTCVLTLRNGFTVTGESACASPDNYRQDIGEKVAFDNAREKIWLLEGYLLRERLASPSTLSVSAWAKQRGIWDAHRMPWLAEIMDAAADPAVSMIAIVGSPQTGKSTVLNCIAKWMAEREARRSTIVEPRADMARFRQCKVGVDPLISITHGLALANEQPASTILVDDLERQLITCNVLDAARTRMLPFRQKLLVTAGCGGAARVEYNTGDCRTFVDGAWVATKSFCGIASFELPATR